MPHMHMHASVLCPNNCCHIGKDFSVVIGFHRWKCCYVGLELKLLVLSMYSIANIVSVQLQTVQLLEWSRRYMEHNYITSGL